MKKTISIILIYAAIIFIACLIGTYAYRQLPELIPSTKNTYRVMRALNWFLMLLPSILLSGFAIACSVIWKGQGEFLTKRFSEAMMKRFAFVIPISLVMVLILSLNYELIQPAVYEKYLGLETAVTDLKSNKSTARNLLNAGQPEIAYQYALRATQLSEDDEEAAQLLLDVKNAVDLARDRALHDKKKLTIDEAERPISSADRSYSVQDLLQKSQAAMDEKDYFQAHYWASLAVQACTETDTNLNIAKAAAAEAWDKLKNPVDFKNQEAYDYYMRKMGAYQALQSGTTSDNLSAYYAFKALSRNGHADDPDIIRYLALAQEAVESEYFFIDETENLTKLENNRNIYFSIENKNNGTKDVIYIKGSWDTKSDGYAVRYLDGLTIVTFSKSGKFMRSMYAPIAKVISQPVSVLDDETKRLQGIQDSWKSIPYVMLQAVDRETKGVVVAPSYSYVESGLPDYVLQTEGLVDRSPLTDTMQMEETISELKTIVTRMLPETRSIILPMPYRDFTATNQATGGPDRMDLATLFLFLKKAQDYGFSTEVFSRSLLGRAMFPLLMLMLFIAFATLGWNYRVDDDTSFKFRWLFLVPIAGAITYLILKIIEYFYDLLNYVIVGAFGGAALWVALGVNVVLLMAVSLYFLARRR
ncbi:MAG: hypothetical protein J6Y69_04120 [Treponema sp.]|nr:hypothetical protein [Treponema sp.]